MPALVETLASYVPALVTRRIAANPALLDTPFVERFSAAVLFADIAGFTPLTETFVKRGPEGVEQLSQLLNDYLGKLINLLTAQGGDIVKFAGDGLLAMWPAGDEPLSVVTQRAAQCGLAVQNALHQYPAAEGISLSLRVVVGVGDIFATHIGGLYQRWEFLIAGSPLVQVSIAKPQTEPGEVILSPEAWSNVQDACVGELLPNQHVRLEALRSPLSPRPLGRVEISAEMDAALRRYIPAALLARLSAGQIEWLAELRRVTVLFVNLPELDYHTSLDQAQTIMRTLQAEIYHYEGSINQLGVDDKGTSLIAAFGLPPLAHEDDAARGAKAALAILSKLRAMGLRGAIGVTTGRVYCGSIGNDTRHSYYMVGAVVNLAARLMQAAPDAILCDENTYQAARVELVFDVLSPIAVKGRAEPVAIYRPNGSPQSTGDATHRAPASIVGRVRERAALVERLEALQHGESGVVTIEGEAGIGKSRLLEDLLATARRFGVRSLTGAGDAIEKSTPYHAWRPIFYQMLQLDTIPDDVQTRRMHVLSHLQSDPDLLTLAPLLNVVLPLDLPENELTQQLSGKVRADNTRELLVRLIQATVTTAAPLLLVIEDAHWLDSASWDICLAASHRIQPLLQVAATRPLTEPLPGDYAQLLQTPAMLRVRLESLPPADAVALVCQRLGVTSLPDSVAALIREKAEGHPFFSEELAYALRESGVIVISGGECRLAPHVDLKAITFPDTVQGVITSRIDRLTPGQQLTMKVASVIGRVFAFRILRDVHPIGADTPQLADQLHVLERLDLTRLDTPEPELAYIFKHIITQETAYHLMLFAQRRELHCAVAEWYERAYADDLSRFYPLLAYHWGAAEVAAKTIDYLELAGEQALRNFANQEARSFFTEALALDERMKVGSDQLRRAHWQHQLGEALVRLGLLAEGREHLERSLARMDQLAPRHGAGLLGTLLGQIVSQVLHRLLPRQFLGRTSRQSAVKLEAANIYIRLAEIYYLANQKALTIDGTFRPVNLAEDAGASSPELALAYGNLCVALSAIPLTGASQAYGRRALAIASGLNDLSTLGHVLLLTSITNSFVGVWAKAQSALDQALEAHKRVGDWRFLEEDLSLMAQVCTYRGQFAESARLGAEIYASAVRYNNIQHQPWGLIAHASGLLRLGQTDAAIALLEKALTLHSEDESDYAVWVNVYGVLALAHCRRGEVSQARQTAATGAVLIAKSLPPISGYGLSGFGANAEAQLALWEADPPNAELRAACQQACKALHTYARIFPIGQPLAWLAQGSYDWLAGKPSNAHRAWQKSLDAAERLGMPYEKGLAHYEMGRHLVGAQSQQHLRVASEIFAQLGASYDLNRVQTGAR